MRTGENRLVATLIVPADRAGEGCGVYVRGHGSRFALAHTSGQLENVVTSTTLTLPPSIEAGSLLWTRQWATNKAGLASFIPAQQLIMLDDTPPSHPTLRGCSSGGRRGDDGIFYQPTSDALRICWDGPGFADHESGVWRLEWQLSR